MVVVPLDLYNGENHLLLGKWAKWGGSVQPTVDTIRQLNDDIYDWTSFCVDIYSIMITTTTSNQELSNGPSTPKIRTWL